jgi:hypothetical protein
MISLHQKLTLGLCVLIFFTTSPSLAQNSVSGRIIDSTGEPLPYVNVFFSNTTFVQVPIVMAIINFRGSRLESITLLLPMWVIFRLSNRWLLMLIHAP